MASSSCPGRVDEVGVETGQHRQLGDLGVVAVVVQGRLVVGGDHRRRRREQRADRIGQRGGVRRARRLPGGPDLLDLSGGDRRIVDGVLGLGRRLHPPPQAVVRRRQCPLLDRHRLRCLEGGCRPRGHRAGRRLDRRRRRATPRTTYASAAPITSIARGPPQSSETSMRSSEAPLWKPSTSSARGRERVPEGGQRLGIGGEAGSSLPGHVSRPSTGHESAAITSSAPRLISRAAISSWLTIVFGTAFARVASRLNASVPVALERATVGTASAPCAAPKRSRSAADPFKQRLRVDEQFVGRHFSTSGVGRRL